jgi:hypothetical protein
MNRKRLIEMTKRPWLRNVLVRGLNAKKADQLVASRQAESTKRGERTQVLLKTGEWKRVAAKG